ncbi:MAG: hypothetical protein ACR2PH_01240, partial [Desulfobulbia bacterium]
MGKLKHLPPDQWPETDVLLFKDVFKPGDIFDETGGAGAHLAAGTQNKIVMSYRRWLMFLSECYADDLHKPPLERITQDRVHAYISQIKIEVSLMTVKIYVANLHYIARLSAPNSDWTWLQSLKARIEAQA